MTKRIAAMLLCLVMCLSLLPAAAFADGEAEERVLTEMITDIGVVSVQEPVSVKDEAADYKQDPAAENTPTVSGQLTQGGLYHLEVPKGGYLYYSFTPYVSDTYYFVSECAYGDPDPVGYVYASSWALLQRVDDAEGLGKNFKVGHYMNAGETFYFCLGLYSEAAFGTIPARIVKEKTGWCRQGDDWYYFDEDSRPASGNYYINGTNYGFYPDGLMAVKDAVYDEEEEYWYFADAKGEIRYDTGWVKGYDGKWYYVVSGGRLLNQEWLKDKGVWYYFVPEMACNGVYRYEYDEHAFKYCYFKANGAWDNTAGWKKDTAGNWYYVNSSGYCSRGWQKVGSTWYYFDDQAKMVTGWREIDGKWYYFQSSGAMKTGWLKSGGSWYYFASSGAMVTGWLYYNGSWYFFESSGAMKTGWLYNNGNWYYLDSSGAMLANTSRKIGGKVYNFASNGVCTNP